MGTTSTENILPFPQTFAPAIERRILDRIKIHDCDVVLRKASLSDVPQIFTLYQTAYQGRYDRDYASSEEKLQEEMKLTGERLWLVAEDSATRTVVGVIVFYLDVQNRLGKAAGVVVALSYRRSGLATALIRAGVREITDNRIEVVYALTRTVNEGPLKAVAELGFTPCGIFPNAVQVENFEHLNLAVYLTEEAKATRRKQPCLYPPFDDIYRLAKKKLALERAHKVVERSDLKLSKDRIKFWWLNDPVEARGRFQRYAYQKRISNSFFPFHSPAVVLSSEDGDTDVFVALTGNGSQASILGYRTDRTNLADLFDSCVKTLQEKGVVYVELLANAYDYMLQQQAYTARFIPSAYFPAMRLNQDGRRDDYFVLSRTCRLLDFSDSIVVGDNEAFLKAYLNFYRKLYWHPVYPLRSLVSPPELWQTFSHRLKFRGKTWKKHLREL